MTLSALVVEGSFEPRKLLRLGRGWLGKAPAGTLGSGWAEPPRDLASTVGTYSEADDMQCQPATENSAVACQCVSCKTRTSQTC